MRAGKYNLHDVISNKKKQPMEAHIAISNQF